MIFENDKLFGETKNELRNLFLPLFTYINLVETQDRFHDTEENELDRAMRQKSFSLLTFNHSKILRLLKSIPTCEEEHLLRLIYEKMFHEIIKFGKQKDYSYNYMCLVSICKNILE